MMPLPSKLFFIFLLLLTAHYVAYAGGIKGIAVENLTGFPLSRTRVTVAKLEGSSFRTVATVTTSSNGQFQFSQLDDGYYQVIARRPGFAEARAGQGYKGGAGTPILVEGDRFGVTELRLKRLGLISGRAVDENRVGLPRVPVSAYTASVPRQILGTGVSDDLGHYRITGLPAGTYLVRTGAAEVDTNLHLMPVYHPFASATVRDARPVTVELDGEVRDIDLFPFAGRTASLQVRVTGCLGIAKLTLSSDQGRKQLQAPCNLDPVTFPGLTPGEYEVLAEGESTQKLAAFTWVQVYSNGQTASLDLVPLPSLHVRMSGGGVVGTQAGLVLRRRDMAGNGPDGQTLAVTASPMQIPPGRWQISARPPGNAYLAGITFDQQQRVGVRRGGVATPVGSQDADADWFEFDLHNGGAQTATVTLSFSAARLSGRVKGTGKEAIGAPVYLVPLSPQTRQQMNGVRVAYAGQDGSYVLEGLARGRILWPQVWMRQTSRQRVCLDGGRR